MSNKQVIRQLQGQVNDLQRGNKSRGSQLVRQAAIPDSGGCETQNTIWDITIFGAPTGGTISLPVTANGVTTTVTFNWNDSASTFKSTLAAGHAEIATTDIDVTGGPFPSSTMRVEFIGDYENTLLPIPTVNYGSLTGGTGRGVIVAMAQRGHN